MAKTRSGRARQGSYAWAKETDDALLARPLRSLGLRIEGSWLEGPIANAQAELLTRDLRLRPHFWLSEEWFSPAGVRGVAIPFYLAHPRLVRLERKKMLEVEGGNLRWCARLLRHELGHAMQHGFALHRRRLWQRHFGLSSRPYPEHYSPTPRSRHFVLHLYQWYAQAHPDEDFAETFAVWLTPGLNWRRRYAGWPALAKLEYVDTLMRELAGRAPLQRSRLRADPIERLNKTLGAYYAERQARYGVGAPTLYDRDLLRLFSEEPRHRKHPRASVFLRTHKTELRRRVTRWTGENQFTLEGVLRAMIARCKERSLHLRSSEEETFADFAILLTARTLHYFYGRRHWEML